MYDGQELAIIAAWKQGQAVPGTYVGKRRRVVYRLNPPH